MAKVRDILSALESIAPERWAFPFDKVGLQVGDPDATISRAVVSMDRSLGAVQRCKAEKAELLLAHHPLIFNPIGKVTPQGHTGKTIYALIQNGIHFIAAHTNWDSAPGGINDALAAKLGLADVKPFGTAATPSQLKLVIFAPSSAAEVIVDTLSEAGAGVIGNYRRCAFITPGGGTFEAGANSQPTIGEPGSRENVSEWRIEMVVPEAKQATILRALHRVHPYETPAYDLYPLAPHAEQPAGRIGKLDDSMRLADFAAWVDDQLDTRSSVWGDPTKKVKTVAVVGGAADGEWMDAQRAGADVFVTGEVKQHIALESSESGLPILASGHYATEHPGCVWLAERMTELVPSVKWSVFEPEPGTHGRPFHP